MRTLKGRTPFADWPVFRVLGLVIVVTLLWTAFLSAAAPLYADDLAAESVRCAAFEDLIAGTRYNVGTAFSSNMLELTVRKFVWTGGAETDAGFVQVSDGLRAAGTGKELTVNNANVQLSLPVAVQGITLRFGEYGGNMNLEVNGDFRNFDNLHDLDGATVGGARLAVVGGDGAGPGELALAGAISSFAVGGQEFYADQLCVFKEPFGDPNNPPQGENRPDLGDAPDSTNIVPVSVNNSAYPLAGIYGYFPTVWAGTPAGAGTGPKHLNARIEGLLGERYSKEGEAIPPAADVDGLNNILAGGGDNANNDLLDDGWRNRTVPINNCQQTTLRVRVARGAANTLARMYLNVWFDGNRDGDWQDVGACQGEQFPEGTARSFEWIVQNYAVNMAAIPAGGFLDIPVTSVLVMNGDATGEPAGEPAAHWLRFTLSEQTAMPEPGSGRPDGRGPDQPAAFQFGETEDYLQLPGEPGLPGILKVSKTVSTAAVTAATEGITVQPGDPLTYTVRILHEGGEDLAVTVMIDELPMGVALAGPVVVSEETPTASPLLANVLERHIKWAGALTPGAQVAIQIPVRVQRCLGAPNRVVNTARVRQTDGTQVTASVPVQVECAEQPPVTVEKRIVAMQGESQVEMTEAEIFPGGEVTFRFKATNRGAAPVVVELRDRLPQGLAPMAAGEGAFAFGQRLRVEAGATATVDIRARLVQDFAADQQLVNVGHYVACLLAAPGDIICAWPRENDPVIQATNPVTLTVRGRDLGDAPDGTNHLGVPMEAYSGVPANYPTVVDAAALPAGPVHENPRPFHLGMLVSREVNADIGPDADPTNNILPSRARANHDLFDDGVRPPAMVLSDCQPATIPVQIFIAPEAAAALEQGTGYLNLWVDANRDGDWADLRECAPGLAGATATVAVEHIVIDYPVNAAALGAGLHLLSVPTSGPVPWPAELAANPAWVRVSLGEKPANKTLAAGGLVYGAGRGYDDRPFRLGETEDYLWRPANDPKSGPDVAIRKEGVVLPGAPMTTTAAANGGVSVDRIGWIIEYANRGNAVATGVEIGDDLAQAGALGELEIKMEPELAYTQDGTQVRFAVGDLLPGEHGRIVLLSGADMQTSGIYTNVAAIHADADADEENNRDDAVVTIGLRAPVIVEPGDGTTCESAVTVRGRAVPGSTVDLFVDGASVAALTADAEGRWSYALTLADGDHTIYAVARIGALVSPLSRTVNVTVNSSLAWSPLSLRFTNRLGWGHRPVDGDGRTDETGWSIRLRPGETYTVSVKLCCAAPSAAVQLVISGTATLDLADADGDQVYTAVFTAPETRHLSGTMILTVQCGDASYSGSGVQLIDPEGQVYDVKTAGTLAGAAVSCLQAQNTIAGASAVAAYDLWPAADYGQVNPQATTADGQFNFFTPAGVYRIAASRTGYQPYRSTDLTVVDEAVHVDIPLTPLTGGTPDHVVVITEYGFEPAFLAVEAGDVVEWVNMAADGHTATSLKSQAEAAAVGEAFFDSGLLLAGERYSFVFDDSGSYAVVDGANPANTASISVDARGAFLFLPAVRR